MRIVVVGGGIVGLAAAYRMTRARPDSKVTVLEKEMALGCHQTGRNSGVIHSGIYYRPGSAKALNCREGRQLLLAFCRENSIEHELCGKVIVATEPSELPGLHELARRATGNGVDAALVDGDALCKLEPWVRGLQALHVRDAGIVDYLQVLRSLHQVGGADVRLGCRVLQIVQRPRAVTVSTTDGEFEADWLVNCAGLQCDRVCRSSGGVPGIKIVPFKGEYYRLRSGVEHLCRNLIYPVPDPAFPFLGVHLTRMIGGGVEAGPNAVLALGREAYQSGDLNLPDLLETLGYRGFWRLAARHWKMGFQEMHRSLVKGAFAGALQRLVPELRQEDLSPAPCGIRAQAVRPSGALEDDFLIAREARCLHVLNAPSPAATSALAIGGRIVEQLLEP
jgi:L-2-hydroxyglutarate oxidase